MIVSFPNLTNEPLGSLLKTFIDTIAEKFLVDKNDIESVLTTLGISREAYAKVNSGADIKAFLQKDLTNLRHYLMSGPGLVDKRFEESVRKSAANGLTPTVLGMLERQPWHKYTLKCDTDEEYKALKNIIGELKTSALYSSYTTDDTNKALDIYTSNTILALDGEKARLANIKNKDSKPLNFNPANLHGKIESNANWISADIYVWMIENGISAENITTERRAAHGLKPTESLATQSKRAAFKEGNVNAIEQITEHEKRIDKTAERLAELGLLVVDEKKELNVESRSEVGDKEASKDLDTEAGELGLSGNNEKVQDDVQTELEPNLEREVEQKDEVAEKDNIHQNQSDSEVVNDRLKKFMNDKLKRLAEPFYTAEILFPEFYEKFTKFAPDSETLEQAVDKIRQEFKELRNATDSKIVEKHLMDMSMQMLFMETQKSFNIQKELSVSQKTVEALKEDLKVANSALTGKTVELTKAKADVSALSKDNEALRETLKITDNRFDEIAEKAKEMHEAYNELKAKTEGVTALENENKRLNETLNNLSENYKNLQKTYDDTRNLLSTTTESQKEMVLTMKNMEEEKQRLTQKIDILESKLNTYKTEAVSNLLAETLSSSEGMALPEKVDKQSEKVAELKQTAVNETANAKKTETRQEKLEAGLKKIQSLMDIGKDGDLKR